MDFNFDNYDDNYVMHCQTEDEAIEFCRLIHENGFRWRDGGMYIEYNEWIQHGVDTGYNWNRGTYGSVGLYIRVGYEILEWSDFRNSVEVNPQDLLDFLGV